MTADRDMMAKIAAVLETQSRRFPKVDLQTDCIVADASDGHKYRITVERIGSKVGKNVDDHVKKSMSAGAAALATPSVKKPKK